MAQEIERKFLVDPDKLPALSGGHAIKQGYIPTADLTTVRVRISNENAYLTIKGQTHGNTRSEFEYPVPVPDAEQMLNELCQQPFIDKTRYLIQHEQHTWELDIFHGDNEGLRVAEVELSSEDERVNLPNWVTQEVSGEVKYYNSQLLKHPYKDWQ